MDCGHQSREGATVAEEGERQTSTQGSAWGKTNPNSNWIGK